VGAHGARRVGWEAAIRVVPTLPRPQSTRGENREGAMVSFPAVPGAWFVWENVAFSNFTYRSICRKNTPAHGSVF
jgi:hypothetical protein